MSFLSPEAFAFAAALPVVVVFYLLKRKRMAKLVSSTVIWQRFLNETQASSPFQKLKHNWLLVLQLLLLALAVFALARPYFSGQTESGRMMVVVLDVSASMQSTDVSSSRLAVAKTKALELVDSMDDNELMVVLQAGANTEVRQSKTSDKSALRQAIQGLEPTDTPTHLVDAIKLAQSLTLVPVETSEEGSPSMRYNTQSEVHLFSDGASTDLDDFELQDLNLIYHQVGSRARNLGIVSMEVRPHPEEPGHLALFATVANSSTNELGSALEFSFEGRMLQSRHITVGPGSTSSILFTAAQAANGIFTLRLMEPDDLTADNQCSIPAILRRETRALLVTKGNPFLEKALRSAPRLALTVAGDLTEADPPHDFVVLDEVMPTVWPECNLLAIRAQSTNWFTVTGVVEAPPIVDWKSAHPLLRFATMENVQVSGSATIAPPPWMESIVESTSTPLVLAGELGGQRIVWTGFNLLDSTWPLRVSFPIFIANAVDWLNPGKEMSTLTGAPFLTRLQEKEIVATVIGPGGTRHPVRTNRSGELSFGNTARQGIYQINIGTNDLRFCVNLLDDAESDIRPREVLELGEYGRVKTSVMVAADKEWWRWFLAVCLGFLLFEWWFYHRRTV